MTLFLILLLENVEDLCDNALRLLVHKIHSFDARAYTHWRVCRGRTEGCATLCYVVPQAHADHHNLTSRRRITLENDFLCATHPQSRPQCLESTGSPTIVEPSRTGAIWTRRPGIKARRIARRHAQTVMGSAFTPPR